MDQSLTLASNVGSQPRYWATAWRRAMRDAAHAGVGRIGNTEARLSSSASFSATVLRNFSPFLRGSVATYASAITRSKINSALGSGISPADEAANNSGTTTLTSVPHPSVAEYVRELRPDNVKILALHKDVAPRSLRHFDYKVSATGRWPNMGCPKLSGN